MSLIKISLWCWVFASLQLLISKYNNDNSDFEIQTDHLIPVRRPDLVKKKKNISSSGICSPSKPQNENERNQIDR